MASFIRQRPFALFAQLHPRSDQFAPLNVVYLPAVQVLGDLGELADGRCVRRIAIERRQEYRWDLRPSQLDRCLEPVPAGNKLRADRAVLALERTSSSLKGTALPWPNAGVDRGAGGLSVIMTIIQSVEQMRELAVFGLQKGWSGAVRHTTRPRRKLRVLLGRLPGRGRRGAARCYSQALNFFLRATQWLRRHQTKFGLIFLLVVVAGSGALEPFLREPVASYFTAGERLTALRSLLVGVGGALVGATAITFSLVMLAVQLNFTRVPHGLFRTLSTDILILAYFVATFAMGLAIGVLSLLPDEKWAATALIVLTVCSLLTLCLFFLAYRRALDLVSPIAQIELVFRKADRSTRRWGRRATRLAPLIEARQNPRSTCDLARAVFFHKNPHWDRDVRDATFQIIAFARRYAEQGEYNVSQAALSRLISIHISYVHIRGKTFFTPSDIVYNPLSNEVFISDTLEQLRRLSSVAQSRSDEQQYIQAMGAMAGLSDVYATIDYGKVHDSALRQSQLAAGYLTEAVERATQTFSADVLLDGIRLIGRSALVAIRHQRANAVRPLAHSIVWVASAVLSKPGFQPVVSTAMQQLSIISFELLRSTQHDVSYAARDVRTEITALVQAVLAADDGSKFGNYSRLIAPYYSLAEIDTFLGRLAELIQSVIQRAAKSEDAERVLRHFQDWSEGMYRVQRELLQVAAKKRSSVAFDMINWICDVTKILIMAAKAPSATKDVRYKLLRNATWLISAVDWLPNDEESIKFIEASDLIERLFVVTTFAQTWEADDVAVAVREILLNYAFKAGLYQNGWNSLEKALTALAVTAVQKPGAEWIDWLTREVKAHLANSTIAPAQRESTSYALRANIKSRGRGGFSASAVDRAIANPRSRAPLNRREFIGGLACAM